MFHMYTHTNCKKIYIIKSEADKFFANTVFIVYIVHFKYETVCLYFISSTAVR